MPSRLLKKPANGPKRHTGRDEVEIRYPVNYFFLDSPPQADFAPSGMTDLMLVLKILSFSAVCSCLLPPARCLLDSCPMPYAFLNPQSEIRNHLPAACCQLGITLSASCTGGLFLKYVSMT